jgi:hypothetical protein
MVSADLILAKSYQVEAGAKAALELQLQQKCERIPQGKWGFLNSLLNAILQRKEEPDRRLRYRAEAYVALAMRGYGEQFAGLSPEASEIVDAVYATFERDPIRAAPVGVYTWSPELQKVFRQDSLAQVPLVVTHGVPVVHPEFGATPDEQFAVARFISSLVQANRILGAEHHVLMDYYSIVGPDTASLTVADVAEATDIAALGATSRFWEVAQAAPGGAVVWRLLPRVFNAEQELVSRPFVGALTGALEPAEQFAASVRIGALALDAGPSGEYLALAQRAMEPFLRIGAMPEGEVMAIAPSYESRLSQVYGGTVRAERERRPSTGKGQGPAEAQSGAHSQPRFRLEPLPTVYLRRAKATRVLRDRLTAVLGAETVRYVRRLSGDERSRVTIWDDLAGLERRLLGCYVLASADLGLTASSTDAGYSPQQLEAMAGEADDWIATWKQDRDLLRDTRFLIAWPGEGPQGWRARSNAGVRLIRVEVLDNLAGEAVRAWTGVSVFLEGAGRGKPPTRQDFRKRLDDAPSLKAARSASGAPGGFSFLQFAGRGCGGVALLALLAGVALAFRAARDRRRAPKGRGVPYAVRRHPRQTTAPRPPRRD